MRIETVTDKSLLENFFRKDVHQFAYHLGDLDDYFFDDCIWYGLFEGKQIEEVILLFSGLSTPTVLIFGFSQIAELLTNILDDLPDRFFCHYQIGLEQYLIPSYKINYLGRHQKMRFKSLPSEILADHTNEIICELLTPDQSDEVVAFYEKAYPDTYFESHMLSTGKYYGIRERTLKSISGVHVYSPKYQIAVLGNIVTDPRARGKGYATICTYTLLQALVNEVKAIGLNVKADNTIAVDLYKNLGFVFHSEYEEALFSK